MENQELQKLADLIRDIKIAMLTTVEEDGTLRSRPMATHEMEEEGVLWFFTYIDSPKIYEISLEHKINVCYADPSKEMYVSVSGDAWVVRDENKIKQLWSPLLKAWFPNGPEDPKIALLRIDITQAEYWDAPDSKMVEIVGMAKAAVTGEPYRNPGENRKIHM